MTTILATPGGWPQILLARPTGADPTDLAAAKAAGAFEGLRIAIEELGPDGTISAIEESGLRGRGGAGYPTGAKWRACAAADVPRRFVVVNGYGADPAVFIDQVLMERDPYAVLEGAAIAAFAVGATEIVIAVRAESAEAIRRLEAAVRAAEDAGDLGVNAMGHGVELTVTIRTVQGAYMLGEETVLLKALEGKRGQPEQRPPHPATRGLFGAPTVVQNVATLVAVPWIMRNGPQAFNAIGAPDAPGTVLVQVSGAARNGIAEVPTGTTLNEILTLAGGVAPGQSVKAVLVGGPSGGLLPASALDIPYEFGALRAAGAHVGSGSVVVADQRTCIVDLARLLTAFCADEACGKTIPCRIGTRRIAEIGDRFTSGRPRNTDLDLLVDLSHDVAASALCDHERLTTLPFTSAMRYFRSELDEHILRSSCPAGVCRPIAVAGQAAAH